MKIGILSFGRPATKEIEPPYEAKRLLDSALARSHESHVFCEPFFSFFEHRGQLEIFYDGKPLPSYNVFITRSNLMEDLGLHLTTLELLQSAGYKIINPIISANNKISRKIALSQASLPIPRSIIVRDVSNLKIESEKIGFPLIVKTPSGSCGRGVFLAENLPTLFPIVDYLTINQKIPVILEEFISEAQGKDIRAFVVGNQVVAAMEREAKIGDIRSNIHAGGTGHPVELTEQEKTLAIQAAQAINLPIAGVDIIRSNHGPLILEVNARPGFEGLEKATGIDVAMAIINYTEKICQA